MGLGRRRRKEAKKAAKAVFDGLSPGERWDTQTALVLGTFDWRDYWDKEPPKGTTSELSRMIYYWEEMRG